MNDKLGQEKNIPIKSTIQKKSYGWWPVLTVIVLLIA